VILLALASLLRVSELAAIDFHSVIFSAHGVKFTLLKPRKAQHGGPLQSFSIPFLSEANCRPVQALKAYVDRTVSIRQTNIKQLFVSTIAPHSGVTGNTISRWIRSALDASGVDTSVFKAHSTRRAAASKASALGISVDEILKAGHWKSESTFSRLYKRITTPAIVPAIFQ
jgi:integrase